MEKYLRLYAEPETTVLDEIPVHLAAQQPWANGLVIPACNETPEFLRPPPPCDGRSLLILVINESVSAPPVVATANRRLAASVRERFEPLGKDCPTLTGAGMAWFRDPLAPRDVLLVDRFSPGRQLPAKGGVGHARKIGADLAAGLFHRGRLRSPWIHCSDADVELPETYFACSTAAKCRVADHAALVYPFRHCRKPDSENQDDVILATRLYEISLRYYVAGLKSAGSPYAFHTIGSTMAVNARHYAQVRGFPRREAAEDFYLLNKLAKVGGVLELEPGPDCGPIRIEARRSDRVPFGTGAAVNTIIGLDDPAKDFHFYNPVVFELLKTWLRSWPAFWQAGSGCVSPATLGASSLDRGEPAHAKALVAGLEKIGASQALDHAFRQSRDFGQFEKQMHTWFDAFRTLKLVHFLRDHGLSPVSYDTLSANPLFGRLFAISPP